ncbi:hypothetical protein ACFSTC_54915 [Nonomuraea ferruginea]
MNTLRPPHLALAIGLAAVWGGQLRRHAGGAGALPAPAVRGPAVRDGGLPRPAPGRPPGRALALDRRGRRHDRS